VLATTGAKVYTVDKKKKAKEAQENITARENIEKANKLGLNITFEISEAVEFLKKFDKKIDLLFLDSRHTIDHIKRELQAVNGKISKSGIIVIHDILTSLGHPLNSKDNGILIIKQNQICSQ